MATHDATAAGPRCCPVALLLDSGLTDGQLLERFVTRREEAAFAGLVRRHGPMVLGVCRRVLGNADDADDAFQATFLILVRRASAVVPREQVGSWLYGVAYRTALKARTAAVRRRARERSAAASRPEGIEPPSRDDLRQVLDRELTRLPDKYRAAVLLCDLEGRSRREAARQLGLAEGTLSSRLATARAMLARRVARCGALLSAGALTTTVVPAALGSSTVRAAILVAAGEATSAAGVSAAVATLTEGVIQTMRRNQLHMVAAMVLAVSLVGGSAGLLVHHALADGTKDAKALPADKQKKEQGPVVRGVATAVDAGKKTITVSVMAKDGSKKTEEKTFPLAADVKVLLAENRTKEEPPPEGKLADVTPGTIVEVQSTLDGKTVERIMARGPGLNGSLKAVDKATNTITVTFKGQKGLEEKTLVIGKGVMATLSEGLSKEDKPQEKKPTELEEGTRILVQMSVDRKTALGITVLHDSLQGTLKGLDTGNNVVSIEVKEDGGLAEKVFTLVKGAKVEGNPTTGDRVNIEISVFDKKMAVRVRAVEK